MLGFDRQILIKLCRMSFEIAHKTAQKHISANTLASKVKSFAKMPCLVPAAV